MKKLIPVFLLIFLASMTLDAQEKQYNNHEWRLGWGDMLFETAVFHNTHQKYNYRYTGHIFAEYQYNFNNWLGAGVECDWEHVKWDTYEMNGNSFYNLTLMPTVRFTYFRKGIVTMYSGLGLGVTMNAGNEIDYKGRSTVFAPALNLTLYGISLNINPHWFGTFEIGGLNALNGKNEVMMAASRIFSISFGYRL